MARRALAITSILLSIGCYTAVSPGLQHANDFYNEIQHGQASFQNDHNKAVHEFNTRARPTLPTKCDPYTSLKKFKTHLASEWPRKWKGTGTGNSHELDYNIAKTNAKYHKHELVRHHPKTKGFRVVVQNITITWAEGEVKQKDNKYNVDKQFPVRVMNAVFSNIQDNSKIMRDPFSHNSYCELLNKIEQACEPLVHEFTYEDPLQPFYIDANGNGGKMVKCIGSGGAPWDCKISISKDALIHLEQITRIAAVLNKNPVDVRKTAPAGQSWNGIKLAHPDRSKGVHSWMVSLPKTSDRLGASVVPADHLVPKGGWNLKKLKEEDFVAAPKNLHFDHYFSEHSK